MEDYYLDYIKNSKTKNKTTHSKTGLGIGTKFSKKKNQKMAKKYLFLKNCSLSLVMREMQIITTLRSGLTRVGVQD